MFSILDFLNIYTVIGCVLVLLWLRNRFASNCWPKLNIKYLEPAPFWRNLHKVLFQLTPPHREFDDLYKALHDEPYGGIYRLGRPQLLVKDPPLISAILVKDFRHFHDLGLKELLLADKKVDPLIMHLSFSDGERWRVLRQKMSPMFAMGKLKLMHDQILDCVASLMKYIDNRMDGNDSVDVGLKDLFEKLTTDVIGSCAFGIDCSSLKSNERFVEMGKQVFKLRFMVIVRTMLAMVNQRLAKLMNTTTFKKEVNDFYLNLALDTVQYRRQNGVVRNDLLQLLMNLQNSHVDPRFAVGDQDQKVLENEEFDELDVAANAFLFFIAGFETTASTLSYCVYELALNEDIQEKLRSEVQRTKSENQTLTLEILKGMTYMEAVITETLRKYPPTIALGRQCTEEYEIPGTKVRLPVGTNILIPIWSIHHDWKNYPNPELFDPERFVGDKKYSHPSGTFLAFGDGPRQCLGKRFAEMEIKAALAEIVLRYDIKPCAKTAIPLEFGRGTIMLQSTCGTWVSLAKRKTAFQTIERVDAEKHA